MNRKRKWATLSTVMVWVIAFGAGPGMDRVQADSHGVIGLNLKADPKKYQGPCPAKIKFDGFIGVNKAGSVTYTFTRSDGAKYPEYKMQVATSKKVDTTWTLGGQKLPSYSGWVGLKILSPLPEDNPSLAAKMEFKANFKVVCTNVKKKIKPEVRMKKNIVPFKKKEVVPRQKRMR